MKPVFPSPQSRQYPAALASRHPRILEKIVQLWADPQLHDYFSQLLLDTRDDSRQGFSFEVASEIVRLRDLHEIATFRSVERKREAARQLHALGVAIGTEEFRRAFREGNQQLVDLFIRAGMRLPQSDEGMPLLIAALRRGHTVIAKMLIDAGVEVNVTDHLSLTPLLIACGKTTRGYRLIAESLIDRQADLNARDLFGHTPLMLAISGGMLDIARLLVQSGADTHAVARKGENALEMLLARPTPESCLLVELILSRNSRQRTSAAPQARTQLASPGRAGAAAGHTAGWAQYGACPI